MKKRREVVITFQEVKDYVKSNLHQPIAIEEIMDAVEPFVMDYIQSPFGFAETDGVNDKKECMNELYLHFLGIAVETDGRVRRGLIRQTVKKEKERWAQWSAWGFGRYMGRLAYLLNEDAKVKADGLHS